ncbi:hypothetical protein [Pontibacter silvestris]|uniref:hypothetical protein n=1 Tax=Pontibacter silvestris TaxID=2305183 RepID=UPI001E402EC7|nr:hypothetical protein [Pontibacter silvestris]MCC9137212.1 hypothetical protein [Pontibacter silvestris]
MPVKPENAKEIRAEVYALGYFRNNEYFNKIADGYTLFGYQLNPSLIYYPASFVRLEAGVFLRKDFGSSGYQNILPTFRAKVQKENWALVFGTLEGSLSHGYIEPLYDFERVITDRVENGVQFLLNTDRVKLDAWIDWRNMIYEGDSTQEDIAGGGSAALALLNKEGRLGPGHNLELRLPVQFTMQHKGGQIDASDLPLLTVVNAAAGLELAQHYPSYLAVERLYTKNYLVGFKTVSGVERMPYENGHGLYFNAGVDTKYADAMLSYWKGNGYVAELGGKLYQSASTTYKYPDYLEENRELLVLRLMKDFEILDNLTLTVRLEPLYDFNSSEIEFSHSFFVNLNTGFFVAKSKN